MRHTLVVTVLMHFGETLSIVWVSVLTFQQKGYAHSCFLHYRVQFLSLEVFCMCMSCLVSDVLLS